MRTQILDERKARNEAGGGGALGEDPDAGGTVQPGGSDLLPPSASGELAP